MSDSNNEKLWMKKLDKNMAVIEFRRISDGGIEQRVDNFKHSVICSINVIIDEIQKIKNEKEKE